MAAITVKLGYTRCSASWLERTRPAPVCVNKATFSIRSRKSIGAK